MSILSRVKLPPPRSEITRFSFPPPSSLSRFPLVVSLQWGGHLSKPFAWGAVLMGQVRYEISNSGRDAEVWSANPVRPRHLPSYPVPRTTFPRNIVSDACE